MYSSTTFVMSRSPLLQLISVHAELGCLRDSIRCEPPHACIAYTSMENAKILEVCYIYTVNFQGGILQIHLTVNLISKFNLKDECFAILKRLWQVKNIVCTPVYNVPRHIARN